MDIFYFLSNIYWVTLCIILLLLHTPAFIHMVVNCVCVWMSLRWKCFSVCFPVILVIAVWPYIYFFFLVFHYFILVTDKNIEDFFFSHSFISIQFLGFIGSSQVKKKVIYDRLDTFFFLLWFFFLCFLGSSSSSSSSSLVVVVVLFVLFLFDLIWFISLTWTLRFRCHWWNKCFSFYIDSFVFFFLISFN